MKAPAIVELLEQAGNAIGGSDHLQVLRSALNIARDRFRPGSDWTWVWIEPIEPEADGMSGVALAEEAYRLAMLHDPEREGLHYEKIKQLLIESGVVIRGGNQGKTVFTALNAWQWFEWIASARSVEVARGSRRDGGFNAIPVYEAAEAVIDRRSVAMTRCSLRAARSDAAVPEELDRVYVRTRTW
jgi:hypothetical protein